MTYQPTNDQPALQLT